MSGGTAGYSHGLVCKMSPDPEDPDPAEPEGNAAMAELREGMKRVRVIVREATQAIGQAPPEGAVLPNEPDPDPGPEDGDQPIIPAQ